MFLLESAKPIDVPINPEPMILTDEIAMQEPYWAKSLRKTAAP
jgi:hypothetical protein